MRTLGPYTTGEIPEPLVVTFTDDEDVAINISAYTAKFVIKAPGTAAVTKDAVVTDGTAGEATYTWVEDDLETPGATTAELWVGNGTNRFASERFVFVVKPALAVPEI